MNKHIYLTIVGVMLFVGVWALAPRLIATAAVGEKIQLTFGHYWDLNQPEHDVFVQKTGTASVYRVYENPLTDATKKKTIYSVKSASDLVTATDPMGPFPSGTTLGMTLGSWLAAKGSATYITGDTMATLSLSFENLKPKGTYTVWCGKFTKESTPVLQLSLCAPQTKPVPHNADTKGGLKFTMALQNLSPSDATGDSTIALMYHKQGVATINAPKYLGEAAHIQLFAFLPAPATPVPTESVVESPESTVEVTPTPTPEVPSSGYSSSIWLIIGLAVVILLVLAVILA